MSVIVKPLGGLKRYIGDQSQVTIAPGCRVLDVLDQLGIPPLVVALVLINDVPARREDVVHEGDVLKLLAVMGGG